MTVATDATTSQCPEVTIATSRHIGTDRSWREVRLVPLIRDAGSDLTRSGTTRPCSRPIHESLDPIERLERYQQRKKPFWEIFSTDWPSKSGKAGAGWFQCYSAGSMAMDCHARLSSMGLFPISNSQIAS